MCKETTRKDSTRRDPPKTDRKHSSKEPEPKEANRTQEAEGTEAGEMLQTPEVGLADMCVKWFSTGRRARKEMDWGRLYDRILKLLMPDLDLAQLMVPTDDYQECMQLYLSSLVYLEKKPGVAFVENLSNDLLVLIKGTIRLEERDQPLEGPITLLARHDKIKVRTESHCILLRGERKQLDKFRNDLLRQDRDKKELFLSQYLFCGLTPVYPLSAVRLLETQENQEIKAEEGLLVLRTGLVRRRCRQKNGGSQLTAGCLINTNRMAQLIEMSQAAEDCSFEAIEPCRFVSFQPEEFSRLIRVNAKLKKSLAAKLAGILEERNLLSEKNEAIAGQFTEQFKLGMQSVRMHYSIQFKNRPKTATAGRSFRKKGEANDGHESLGEFVTYNRYEKMMASKERVADAMASYQGEPKSRIIIPVDYEKRIKQQSKMMKLQSGKIQKLTQRESRTDNSRMHEIKRNLFRVTHLFDQPIDPDLTINPDAKMDYLTEPRKSNLRRMSGIKPEQFLKEEYLTEFYKKSTVRSSMKELSLGGSSGSKENMGFPLSGYSNYSKENVACIKESLTLNYSKEGLAGKCREILNTGSCKARKSGMKQQRRSSPFRTGILRMGGIQ